MPDVSKQLTDALQRTHWDHCSVIKIEDLRNAITSFFRTLPDGLVLEILKNKRPHESWREAVARELDMLRL